MQSGNQHADGYLKAFRRKHSLEEVKAILRRLEGVRVLLIGDTILDQYVFVVPKGRAIKDPILSVGFKREETYAGGILAIANHLATFVKEVTVATLIGEENPQLDFITGSVMGNVHIRHFVKKGSPTIVKRRYVDVFKDNKLFKVEHMNDHPIEPALSREIASFIAQEAPLHDLVIVGDFGHGFINAEIRKALEDKSRFLAVNIQSNSSNMGYNYVNHYAKPHYLTLDEQELRLPLMMRFEPVEDVVRKFSSVFTYPHFLVTLGKQGCLHYNKGSMQLSPVFTSHVVDTIGAGDAVFSITSLLAYAKAEDDLVPFVGNCAGAVKTQYHGNKESVTKEKLVSFMEELLK